MNWLVRGLRLLLDAVGQVGIWLVVPIMLLVMTEVVLRSIFGTSLIGVNEVVEFLLVAFVFLGLGRSSLAKAHVTVTIITEKLSPSARNVIDGAMSLIAAAVWLLASWQTLLNARVIQVSQVMSPTVDVPIHPFIYLTGFGCGLMGIAQLVDVATRWRGRGDA